MDKLNFNALDMEDEKGIQMVNSHYRDVHNAKDHQERLEGSFQKALEESLREEEFEYTGRKRVRNHNFQVAVVTVAIIASFFVGSHLGSMWTEKSIHYNNVVVEITDKTSNEIDKKIEDYMTKMGKDGPRETRIVEQYKFDPNNPGDAYGDAFVDFFPGILCKDIIDASKSDNPIIEVRCALIAAINIINKPYVEENFNKIFSNLMTDVEFRNNTGLDNIGFDFSDDVTDIWHMLGYQDMDDFYKNARRDTKEIMSIMENYYYGARRDNGKGM